MRVVVDSSQCQGHNRCCVAAPEVFDLNDELKSVVQLDPVPADLESAVLAAVRNCPERAIRTTE